MAVLLEEGELSFRGNWGLVLEPKEIEKWWLAGCSLQTCPAGSLRDFLQKRYIFVRELDENYYDVTTCYQSNGKRRHGGARADLRRQMAGGA